MAENDFVVNFGTDDFQVIFGEQGPQGPASVAVPFDINDTYEIGNIVYDPSGNLFGSRVDDNTGNALSDTNFWVALGIAAGAVTQLDDLTDVLISSPTSDQILSYSADDSAWINTANHGGNTPVDPGQDKLSITLNPSSITLMPSGTQTVTATPGINSGFTINSVSWQIKDQDNHTITPVVDPVTFVASFTADQTVRGSLSVSMVVSYTRDSDSSTGTDNKTATIPVRVQWFSAVQTTVPTGAVGVMVDQGVFTSPERFSTTTNGSNRNLYLAVPFDGNPYTFGSGQVFFDAVDLEQIDTNWHLYQITDFDDSIANRTFIVDITEGN